MANFKTYTVNDLIASVKRRGAVPIAQNTFSSDDLLVFANEVMDETLGPIILSLREEFYLTHEDITTETGSREYPIPYRAFGSKVRIIKPVDSSGKEGLPLTAIALDQTYEFNYDQYSTFNRGFYLKNDSIVLTQDPSGIGSTVLRLYYYLRPNDMVVLNRASKIRSVDFDNNMVTVETVPSNISTGVKLDLIQSLPNFKTYDFDLTANVNAVSKVITFTDPLPDNLQAGDYICTAGETVCPPLPADVIPVLEQSTVCKVLEAQGDTEGLKNAYARLEKLESKLFNLIDQRLESPGKKAVSFNSFLRRGKLRFGGY